MDTFELLWGEHVDFGTSRSHKKLLGKTRKEEPEWKKAINAKEKAAREAQLEQPEEEEVAEMSHKARKRQKKQQQQQQQQQRQQAAPVITRPGSIAPAAQASTSSGSTAPKKMALPSTGRFGSTLAAKLLGL